MALTPVVVEALARYLRVRRQHTRAYLDALWMGTKGELQTGGVLQMLRRRGAVVG